MFGFSLIKLNVLFIYIHVNSRYGTLSLREKCKDTFLRLRNGVFIPTYGTYVNVESFHYREWLVDTTVYV